MGPEVPDRVPRDLADSLLREIGSWLDRADPAWIGRTTRAWDGRTRAAARRLIGAQGLGPVLARDPALTPILAVLPEEIASWVARQGDLNKARIEVLHEELAAALRALAGAGIEAMPLKGSILTTRHGLDPYCRPMADLDILVRPADREAARTAIAGLGYERRPARNRRPTHDTFLRQGNEQVVEPNGEHPDNPRPIELHVEVKRHLWAWVDDDELTDFLWAGSTRGSVLGEQAVLPTPTALFAHLAIHATSDLLTDRGRLVQWLDLVDGTIDPGGDAGLAAMPHPRLVFPAVHLSRRRFPGRTPAPQEDLATVEARVPAGLIRWAAGVPLDTRAGLQSGRFGPGDMGSLGARWQRWAPSTWRLAVAYGDVPLPVALARHAAVVAGMTRKRQD